MNWFLCQLFHLLPGAIVLSRIKSCWLSSKPHSNSCQAILERRFLENTQPYGMELVLQASPHYRICIMQTTVHHIFTRFWKIFILETNNLRERLGNQFHQYSIWLNSKGWIYEAIVHCPRLCSPYQYIVQSLRMATFLFSTHHYHLPLNMLPVNPDILRKCIATNTSQHFFPCSFKSRKESHKGTMKPVF